MKKTILKFGLLGITFLPIVTFAETKTLRDLVSLVVQYLTIGIYLIISLAVVTFVWNIYKYFFMPEADRKEAGKYVMYSLIGFFIILSFWGLVYILSNSLKLPTGPVPWPFGGSSVNSKGGGGIPDDNSIKPF